MTDGVTGLQQRALRYIETCADPAKLRQIANNARAGGDEAVLRAARLRLYAVSPAQQPGTLEHAVWQSIHALEDTLTEERGTTVRLGRTRQKIARAGELATVRDLITGKASDGFALLIERDMAPLTFEAVALRFPERFDAAMLGAAAARLREAGWSPPA